MGLAIRPAMLAILARLGYNEEAYELGLYYFVISTSYIIFHTDAHIEHYKAIFSKSKSSQFILSKTLRQYIGDKLVHICVFFPVLWIILYAYINDGKNTVIYLVLILIERIMEEWLRIFIFNNQYATWSKWFLLKSFLLALSVFISAYTNTDMLTVITCAMVLLLFKFNFETGGNIKNIAIINKYIKNAIKNFNRAVGAYWKKYLNKYFFNQISAIFAVNVMQVDKWFVGKIAEKNMFVEIVLLTQLCSIFVIFVDNFFMSVNRSRFVSDKTSIYQVMNWRMLMISGVAYWTLMYLFLVYFSTYIGISEIGNLAKGFMIAGYVIFGFSAPLSEYFYWKYPRIKAAIIDGLFIIISVALMIIICDRNNIAFIYIITTTLLLGRLLAYYFYCIKWMS